MLTLRTILLLIFSIINTALIVFLLILSVKMNKINKYFLYLTNQNFIWCTVYLFIITLYEIRNKTDSKIYIFIHQRIGKCLFAICLTVVFSFWTYVLMGENVMNFPKTATDIIISIYLHFVIGVIMGYELLSSQDEHYVKGVFHKDFLVLLLINIVYSSIMISLSKKYDLKIYKFIQYEVMNIIGYMIVSTLNLIISYLIYYSYVRRYRIGVLIKEGEVDNKSFNHELIVN